MGDSSILNDFPYMCVKQLPWASTFREYELITRELSKDLGNINEEHLVYIRTLILNWRTTNESGYMDFLVIFCFENKILLPEVAQVYLAQSAIMRWNGDASPKVKIQKQAVDRFVYAGAMYLIEVLGMTKGEACQKIAALLGDRYPKHSRKASSIDKGYTEWKSKNYFYMNELNETDWEETEAADYVSRLDEFFIQLTVSPDLIGERR
ncbi:hypothetical protein [Vibrio sp. 10N.286.48.F5]|uniref:hypothetical protein n=1 Tax=Vibrio sp. 10N.286.48.F5 TaxID=3229699 RepID=UPI00354B719B